MKLEANEALLYNQHLHYTLSVEVLFQSNPLDQHHLHQFNFIKSSPSACPESESLQILHHNTDQVLNLHLQ